MNWITAYNEVGGFFMLWLSCKGNKNMQIKKIKLYSLYELDRYGRPRFAGRFASLQKVKAAAMFMSRWFYEVEEKQDEYGQNVQLTA